MSSPMPVGVHPVPESVQVTYKPVSGGVFEEHCRVVGTDGFMYEWDWVHGNWIAWKQ